MRLILKLKEENKHYFKRPIGIPLFKESGKAIEIVKKIIEDFKPPIIATIGDVVSYNALLNRLNPSPVIFDMKVERKRAEFDVGEELIRRGYKILEVQNPPSTITLSSYRAIERAIDESLHGSKVGIRVVGEDDLLTIPVILLAPLRSIILYGQPKEALITVLTTKYLRDSLRRILLKLGANIEC